MGPKEITRRSFLTKSGIVFGAAALAPVLPQAVLRRLGGGLWLPAALASTGVVLDPSNPSGSGFQSDGTEAFMTGAVLRLIDDNVGGSISFFANHVDAAAGIETDVVATFQVISTAPNGADAGNHLVINDGVTRSAIAACVVRDFVLGLGLYSQGPVSDAASYPVFVPVDWEAAPTTVRLRRTAAGDAEIVEVNGVAPSPRALLAADQCPGRTRPGTSFEFGARGVEAECTVDYSAFRSERVIAPVAGMLAITSLRLRNPDSSDRIQLRADYTLGGGSDGIDPAAEPVTIKLSTPAGGQFYPATGVNPLDGFDVRGSAPRRRWTLNESERARTGIEQLVFDEDPDNSGGVSLRDGRTSFADADYSNVNVEITIGTGATQDRLTGTASLAQSPAGSGSWRLS